MSQTHEGGRKTREHMIERYGSEEAWKQVMRDRGSMGGKKGTTGGFGQGEEGRKRARAAGKLGGQISRRTKAKV